MSIERLESISLNNFRSIGGQITVPLDAQVVLVHGPNGSGKTSLLSGVELALTGSIDAMRRADPTYRDHLVHKGAARAELSVTTRTSGSGQHQVSHTSSNLDGWASDGVLTTEDARYFSERCYLAQATLGRLLEIYERKEAGQDSALSRFVSDVLGLDTLENLIEGLRQAKDLRNTRNLVPEIREIERELAAAQQREDAAKAEYDQNSAELREIEAEVSAKLALIDGRTRPFSQESLDESLKEVDYNAEDSEVTRLVGQRREVHSMRDRLTAAQQSPVGIDLSELENRASVAERERAEWLSGVGARIDLVLDEARELFPDLPSVETTSPSEAVDDGLRLINVELRRTIETLSSDDSARSKIEQLTQERERTTARLALIEEQFADETAGSAEIARLLAELIPHMHDSQCLVCGRDYSEVSAEPLAAEVARRASRLSEQAERLAALAQARSSAKEDLGQLVAATRTEESRTLESSARSSLISKRSRLETWTTSLNGLKSEAIVGSAKLRESAEARRALASARSDSAVWSEISESAARISAALGLESSNANERLESAVAAIERHVEDRIAVLEERLNIRRDLSDLRRTWRQINQRRTASNLARQDGDRHRLQLEADQARIEHQRERAKTVLRTATSVQRSIIRTVFNENLNSVWRDLFVRLAPNEPFVPAFHISDDQRDPSPQLTTSHRGGGQGGSPGTMLSAGNLNTAALTLFLALHLSAGQRLPLLLLDDPVQSMDDVHISQFAALLRTLSKQHNRQIVVAVHERALFDYLTLELSPAFEGDRLITIELKKLMDGSSSAEPVYYQWQEDPVSATA